MNNSDQPAFPIRMENYYLSGLTVRQWLAGMALQGILANPTLFEGQPAKEAVLWADEILKELNQPVKE
jgi:hypothetical protein